MNRIRNVNRLFLMLIIVSVGSPFVLGRYFTDVDFYQSVSLSQLVFLIPMLLYLALTKGEILEKLQLKIPKLSVLIMVGLFANMMQPLMACLNLVSQLFVENYVAIEMLEVDGFALGRNMMYIAMVPALAEEFLFRGIFYHSYRPCGIWKASLVSGLCFGLVHMNINQFLYAFVLGVIFALLVEATGSVFSAILAHFIINAGSVSMLALQEELELMMGNAGTSGLTGAAETVGRQDILLALQVYAVSALICTVIAYFIFKTIARWSGREEHMWSVLHPGKTPRTSAFKAENDKRAREYRSGEWNIPDEMETETPSEEKTTVKERILTPALLMGIAGAVTYMIVVEFLL